MWQAASKLENACARSTVQIAARKLVAKQGWICSSAPGQVKFHNRTVFPFLLTGSAQIDETHHSRSGGSFGGWKLAKVVM